MSGNTRPGPFEKCPIAWVRGDCWACSQCWARRGAFFWSFSPGPSSVAAVGPGARGLNPWSLWGQVPGVLGNCSWSSVVLSQMLKVAHVHVWTCMCTHMCMNTHTLGRTHQSLSDDNYWMIYSRTLPISVLCPSNAPSKTSFKGNGQKSQTKVQTKQKVGNNLNAPKWRKVD